MSDLGFLLLETERKECGGGGGGGGGGLRVK